MPATPVAIRECRGGHLLASETSDCVALVYHDLRPAPPVANPRAPRHAREDVPSSLEGWHARVEHHAQHAPPAAWECCTRAVRHAVHLAALRNSPRQLPRCERFGLASTLSKHSTLHDLSHVLDARVHLMRVLEAAGAAGRERARLEYAEARWQRLEADGPTLRGCCVLAAA